MCRMTTFDDADLFSDAFTGFRGAVAPAAALGARRALALVVAAALVVVGSCRLAAPQAAVAEAADPSLLAPSRRRAEAPPTSSPRATAATCDRARDHAAPRRDATGGLLRGRGARRPLCLVTVPSGDCPRPRARRPRRPRAVAWTTTLLVVATTAPAPAAGRLARGGPRTSSSRTDGLSGRRSRAPRAAAPIDGCRAREDDVLEHVLAVRVGPPAGNSSPKNSTSGDMMPTSAPARTTQPGPQEQARDQREADEGLHDRGEQQRGGRADEPEGQRRRSCARPARPPGSCPGRTSGRRTRGTRARG